MGAIFVLTFVVGWQFRMQAAQVAEEVQYVYDVAINGESIAQVKDPNAVQKTIEQLKADAARKSASSEIQLKVNEEVSYSPIKASVAGPLTPIEEVENYLRERLTFSVKPTTIVIDDQPVVTVANEQVANEVIAQIEADYRASLEKENVRNVRNVAPLQKVQYRPSNIDDYVSKEKAIEILQKGTDKEVTYTVVTGDSLWTIANDHGMTVDDLRRANPQLKGDLLHEGDVLNMTLPRPYLSFRSEETVTKIETIPYSTQVEADNSMYTWQQVVRRQGKNGKREVVLNVLRVNGIVVEEEKISERVLEEPVPAIVVQGTRKEVATASLGGGALAWPAQGVISSRFGPRSGGFHSGLDIAAPWGTPVYAAESGEVVFAGWSGGYGNLIRISHGGGVVTFYAHLSKINVKVGQQVKRGELIGNIGSTGRSTGSHLHLEVRVNGVPKNPLTYLQ